jgi:hypothetical protein
MGIVAGVAGGVPSVGGGPAGVPTSALPPLPGGEAYWMRVEGGDPERSLERHAALPGTGAGGGGGGERVSLKSLAAGHLRLGVSVVQAMKA